MKRWCNFHLHFYQCVSIFVIPMFFLWLNHQWRRCHLDEFLDLIQTSLLALLFFQTDDSEMSNPNDDVTDTVVAKLVYDETLDELTDLADAETSSPKPNLPVNPIFEAFKDATGVDDLYRIAEIWVNPPTFFSFPKSWQCPILSSWSTRNKLILQQFLPGLLLLWEWESSNRSVSSVYGLIRRLSLSDFVKMLAVRLEWR